MHEPLIIESRGADVLAKRAGRNRGHTDGDNRITTVYFLRIIKLPVRVGVLSAQTR